MYESSRSAVLEREKLDMINVEQGVAQGCIEFISHIIFNTNY